MNQKIIVKAREYYDSVRLMQAAEKVRREDGVQEAMLMMATDNNKRLLEVAGLLTGEVSGATANDLVIAIVAASEAAAAAAARQAERLLTERVTVAAQLSYRTLDAARAALPGANLAVISVPGDYAASEARRALEAGLNVMLFSDNVSLEDEVSLKRLAAEKELLLMGPDCGTAILNGVGLGFANVVKRGPIGIVGASGTGIQEISALIDRYGSGVSQAIGTGGRDLSPAVGGATMLAGIELLEADPATRVVVLTSKPPDAEVSRAVLQRAAVSSKPVVVNFLGGDPALVSAAGVVPALTLEEAAWTATCLVKDDLPEQQSAEAELELERLATAEAEKLGGGQKYLRGVFSGGTLGYEAMLLLEESLGSVYANIPLQPEFRLDDPWRSREHTLVDLGEDEFTRGRPHPMIDSTLRAQRLLEEARDPETAVLLLDIVLGYGAHPDPAGSLAEALRQARAEAAEAGRYLPVVASICGTSADPQDLATQEETLQAAGVVVASSNAAAARLAGRIIQLVKALERQDVGTLSGGKS